MNTINFTLCRFAFVLFISSGLIAGCSGSGSGADNSSESQAGADNASGEGVSGVDDGTSTGTDNPDSSGEFDDDPGESITSPEVDTGPEPTGVPVTSGSDALQVRVVWGDIDIAASWVGDEFWSASAALPTNTENLLNITFYDRDGEITLGSFETAFRTGSNEAEPYTVAAAQFDTARWDGDEDGISNIDELNAGSDPFSFPRVLLFSETRGYRHESIADALEALEQLASSAGIQTSRADDSAGAFTETNLATYDAVVWVLTSGDVLDADEQAAFENYIRSGGGYAGIHAASDTEYEWPWYGDLVGAYFERHPEIQSATQTVENRTHPSTLHLNSTWTRTDEWYDFRTNPRARVNVLLSLDENTYTGGEMGDDHPSAWYHEYDGGRSWYTGGGHTIESYAEAEFRTHLLGGLRYAAGL